MAELDELRSLLADHDPVTAHALDELLSYVDSKWVTVYENLGEPPSSRFVLACLLPPDQADGALARPGFDFQVGNGRPGFVSFAGDDASWSHEYLAVGEDPYSPVPLVFCRWLDDSHPLSVDLAEDFRMFWDLHQQPGSGEFFLVDELGDEVVVARQTEERLEVKGSFLRRYQAARQLALSIQFDVRQDGGEELADLLETNLTIESDSLVVSYHGGSRMFGGDPPNYTRLLGKLILFPRAVEDSDTGPFERGREYELFTYDIDELGRPIRHTCDPDWLSVDGAPHFLTPVVFDRDVLERYYNDPERYSVEDGYLRAGDHWGLPIDNAQVEHVVVFLGDLGHLPHREQLHWRSFNLESGGGLSETAFRRSLLGQWTQTTRVEFRFSRAHADLNQAWQQRFGWDLFRSLHPQDEHLAHSVRVPGNRSFAAFDPQVTDLAKVVVGYLDERHIVDSLDTKLPGTTGGITKLELLLEQLELPTEVCAVLREIQGARSHSGAHPKTSDFDVEILLNGAPDLPSLFESWLERLVGCFVELEASLTALESE